MGPILLIFSVFNFSHSLINASEAISSAAKSLWTYDLAKKNKALDYLKHEEVKRAAFESMNDWHLQELSIRISTLESCDPNEIFSNEVENIIQNTLKSLSKQTCQAFLLSRFENKSNKEIAEQMGISVKGVEYHISKSLKALRISLKDYLPLFYFFFYY